MKNSFKILGLALTLVFISLQAEAYQIEYRMNHPLPFWGGKTVVNVPAPSYHYSPSYFSPFGRFGFGLGGVYIQGGYSRSGYGLGYGLRRSYSPLMYRGIQHRIRAPRVDYRLMKLNKKITQIANAKINNYYKEQAVMHAQPTQKNPSDSSDVTINIVEKELNIPMEKSMHYIPKEIKTTKDQSVIMKTY